ncbi:hypothetical protein PQS90_18995 [Pseudomonas sp. BLCC-B13]|uniref:hypothetical protein n=1 Tax=Pseudomonas sp. BLCC-B13 TaxID=3025314 RepID=UPI00234E8E37|nr:hypothetical protein [Pseudomonas sp. BLCC-B13]MDC7827249.1 hypothetical protein [Pseudomonas sp. BLCC-B13]
MHRSANTRLTNGSIHLLRSLGIAFRALLIKRYTLQRESMIFAEIEHPEEYWEFHEELKQHLSQHFENVEHGLQADSWFWVFIEKNKVAIDTFSSMKHQVKSAGPGSHVQYVISVLQEKYKVNVYLTPELEGHGDFL